MANLEDTMGGSPDYSLALAGLHDTHMQTMAQRAFVDRTTRKGPLWFWEHIPDPYLDAMMSFTQS
jgi:hypothetical protein